MSEYKQNQKAVTFARRNKKSIAKKIVQGYSSSDRPLAIFMAGAPGAGKTEYARQLVKEFNKDTQEVLHIDADELRSEFLEYTGSNSHEFQSAMIILVEKIVDLVFQNKISFILDGTLSSFSVADKNIRRAIKKGYQVWIFVINQDPIVSWEFTKKREQVEGRKITKEIFIKKLIGAIKTVQAICDQEDFHNSVLVFPVEKTYNNQHNKPETQYHQPFYVGKGSIDRYMSQSYNEEELSKKLCD